jgi:tetratricopeptide (TPR) repeat protein
MQLGRFENAYADLNQALRISPQYVNALHNRGLLKARAGELDAAILDFTEAMMLDPTNPKYYQHRSETYAALGQSDEAMADLRKVEWMLRVQELNRAVAAQPRSAAAWTNRAEHYWQQGDESRAKSDLEQALSLGADYGPALVLQGKIALSEQRHEEALQISAAALETDEIQAAYSIRGDALLALGRYDEALESYAAAKRFDASVAEAYFRKSQSLASQGLTEEAQVQLEQALELDPDVEQRLR